MDQKGMELKVSDDIKRVETANDVFRAMPFKEKYVFCRELGSGGSGTVFQAYDRHLECYVAVKRFRAGDGIPGRELEMLKELRHPAFPAVMDYLEEDGYRYLVMEYIEGRNLSDYIRDKGAVRQEQAVQWALELAEVLRCLHERECPVVYRDMKPANVIIDGKGKVRLVDFGTALPRYQDGQEEYVGGTWGYAAPEQFSAPGGRGADEKSDVYGLGATLFHMLTGCDPSKPPFLMQSIRSYDRSLSAELERIVGKATERERGKRYPNIRQMKQALENYGKGDRVREYAVRTVKLAYAAALGGCMFVFLRSWAWMEKQGYRPAGGTKPNAAEERLLLAAGGILLLCIGKGMVAKWFSRGCRSIRQEKNVLLTAKRGKGLVGVLLLALLAAGTVKGIRVSAESKPMEPMGEMQTEVSEQDLFVVVRSGKGQKLLVRYDAEYPLTETLKLELPLKNFAQGEHYELRLECTNRETGETSSRIFYLKGLEP